MKNSNPKEKKIYEHYQGEGEFCDGCIAEKIDSGTSVEYAKTNPKLSPETEKRFNELCDSFSNPDEEKDRHFCAGKFDGGPCCLRGEENDTGNEDNFRKEAKLFFAPEIEKAELNMARTISIAASSTGLAPKDLASSEDWKKEVEKIRNQAIQETDDKWRKILNSGKKMYQIGKQETIERAVEIMKVVNLGEECVERLHQNPDETCEHRLEAIDELEIEKKKAIKEIQNIKI